MLFTPDVMTLIADEETLADPAPLVFINACRAAGLALSYNNLQGWATMFMKAGAAAFIGSLWEVTDEISTQFAIETYDHLKSGSSLGKAIMAARKTVSQSSADPTWLAYTVYGDPRATVNSQTSYLPE
jgi:CHAT domain-containing protein